jgi:hypothetical protein
MSEKLKKKHGKDEIQGEGSMLDRYNYIQVS